MLFFLATGLKLKLKIPVPDREANPKRKSKRKLQEEPLSSDDELSITREDIFPPNPKHQKLQFDLTTTMSRLVFEGVCWKQH